MCDWLLSLPRLCQRDGAAPARTHPLPHRLSVGQEGSGALHHVLDTQSVRPLGRRSAPRDVPQATHDRGEWSVLSPSEFSSNQSQTHVGFFSSLTQ